MDMVLDDVSALEFIWLSAVCGESLPSYCGRLSFLNQLIP